MGYGKGARQAYDIRDLTAAEAIALLQPDPPDQPPLGFQDRLKRAMAVTSLVKAWEAACDRIRIARGQPLPGSLRPAQSKPRPPRRQSGLAQPPQPKPEPDKPAA